MMLNENGTPMSDETSSNAAMQQAMARKAKALKIGMNTGKAIGLMAVGAALTIGITKFRNRNNDSVTLSVQ